MKFLCRPIDKNIFEGCVYVCVLFRLIKTWKTFMANLFLRKKMTYDSNTNVNMQSHLHTAQV